MSSQLFIHPGNVNKYSFTKVLLYRHYTTVLFLMCNLVCYSQPQFTWAKQIGGANNDAGYSVAVDSSAHVYTLGRFSGTADFDPGPGIFNLTANGADDIFLSELDQLGNFVEAQLGPSAKIFFQTTVKDKFGNIFNTGEFSGTVDFDPGPNVYLLTSRGSTDIYVSKKDAAGNFVWALRMGSKGEDFGYSIAVDLAGNIYATGEFRGAADFGPYAIVAYGSTAGISLYGDCFITKIDASGNFLWAKSMGGASTDYGGSVTVDTAQNVYVAGHFENAASGNAAMLAIKLDTSGNFLWTKSVGGFGNHQGRSIAADASGNVYLTGHFYGIQDFDPGAGVYNLTAAGFAGVDIFVSKLDGSGNFLWAVRMGGSGSEEAYSISLDSAENIYITGAFMDTVDFDGGPNINNLISSGAEDVFVLKMSQQTTLPVTLLNLNAIPFRNTCLLTWHTAQELNLQSFMIERSVDATHFSTVAAVAASGYSPSAKSYSYTDSQPFPGISYYRLRMVDKDGAVTYSPIIKFSMEKEPAVAIYPNPAGNVIHLTGLQKFRAFYISDFSGHILLRQDITSNSQSIDINRFPAGKYWIKFVGDEIQVKSFIRQ